MREINITVRDKVAVAPSGATIICGNSDYVIVFDFDEEWGPYTTKTARFSYSRDGITQHEDKVFSGDSVEVPILNAIHSVKVGVFAGDLHTTTGASIVCQKSILCDSGSPEQPPEDVYAQIMELVNDTYEVAKSVREDADNGVFNGEKGDKGDKGDAGVINFVVVAELPKEGNGDSIYLLPESDGEATNRFGEYVFVDGRWERIGSASVEVNLDEFVKKTDYATADNTGVVRIGTGLKMAGAILQIHKASDGGINSRASDYNPIVPSNLDYAVRAALTDPKKVTWSDDNKASARELIGAVGNADYAGSGKSGIVSVAGGYGITTNPYGLLYLTAPSDVEIREKTNNYKPITPKVMDYAVKNSIATNTNELTEDEKANACEWMGAVKQAEYNGKVIYQGTNGGIVGDAYVAHYTGNQTTIPICTQNNVFTIVCRDASGNFYIGDPTIAYHATNKKYVDNLIAELTARIEALESMLNAEQ